VLSLLLACNKPAPLVEVPSLPPEPATIQALPPVCSRDVTDWKPPSEPGSVLSLSIEQVGRMGAPSLTEGVRRACDCIADGQGELGVYRMYVSAKPALGTSATILRPEDSALARCVGSIETTFEGWGMPCSDAIDPTTPPDPDCAATIHFPIGLDLSLEPDDTLPGD
jgi:hypothetical protein